MNYQVQQKGGKEQKFKIMVQRGSKNMVIIVQEMLFERRAKMAKKGIDYNMSKNVIKCSKRAKMWAFMY